MIIVGKEHRVLEDAVLQLARYLIAKSITVAVSCVVFNQKL